MTSQAEKLRRKRQQAAHRAKAENANEPRSLTFEEAADKLALETRARQFGVTVSQAKDPRVATWHGRLCMRGTEAGGISVTQYDALERYRDVRNKWRSVKCIPGRDSDTSGAGGDIDPAWCKSVCDEHDAMMGAIREAQNESRRNFYAVLDHVVMRGEELEYMIGDLRLVANVLSRHFGLDGRRSKN